MVHELHIPFEEIELYAHTNLSAMKGDPKAIVLRFFGLGFSAMFNEVKDYERELAEKGIALVVPYYGPWSWMNQAAVTLTDGVVEAIVDHFVSLKNAPIISIGGSMGGLAALVYTRYARITPTACAAECPVCDLVFHRTERPDLPRTIYCAFAYEGDSLEKAIEEHSPIHLVDSMPDVPYFVVHGDADQAVNKASHSDRFVAAMRETGHNVEYYEEPGMEHCNFTGHAEAEKAYWNFIDRYALNK